MRHYKRTFHLSASHFNGAEVYELWEKIILWEKNTLQSNTLKDIITLLQSIHGHDFIVTVSIQLYKGDKEDIPMVLEDELIEEIIMKYNRTNWSVFPELSYFSSAKHPVLRATTERVAAKMCKSVVALFKLTHHSRFFNHGDPIHTTIPYGDVTVSIQETKDIIVSHKMEVACE